MHINELVKPSHLEVSTTTPMRGSWIELDKSAFFNNINQFRNLVGPATTIAIVVKANAYGHGLLPIATLCEQHPEVNWLCPFSLQEAVLLRNAGITKPILVLGGLDDDLEKAVMYNIDCALYDYTTACQLNAIAARFNKKAMVHIKIDTGLTRLGWLAEEAFEHIVAIAQLPNIIMRGIFSHFSEADLEDATYTHMQMERFATLINRLEQAGIAFAFRHLANTSATLRFSKEQLYYTNFIRIGGGSYGLLKPYIAQIKENHFVVKPVLTWKAPIIQLKQVPAGTPISYARTFTTTRTTIIATIPVGYCDGYDRRFSNTGALYVHGKAAPILGRVGMNMILIDVTEIPEIKLGDEVTLLGQYPDISADDLTRALGTINYEFLTRINPRIPRLII